MLLLDREIEKLKKQLAERKIIEKAKSILIEKKSCTEEDAYTYIRKISMNKGVSMEKIAEAIIKSLDSSR
jgi:response regulator NasT